jgi:hypothetical protein
MLLAYSERGLLLNVTQGCGRGGLTLGFIVCPRWGRSAERIFVPVGDGAQSGTECERHSEQNAGGTGARSDLENSVARSTIYAIFTVVSGRERWSE